MAPNIIEKFEELTTAEGIKKHWAFWLMIPIISLGLYLRYMPEQGMQYLQALDPYMIYRVSQHVALEGNVPQYDFLRYFPYNAPIYLLNLGDIFIPAVMYWMGPFLVFGSFLEWAQFYPALMGTISVVIAYFLGKELWNKTAGVSGAFFLSVIAGAMHRTSAGFFEKEPVGTMLMMASMYFFIRAWKYKENHSGLLSGVALGLFTISWGGSQMLWLLYALLVGIVLLIDEDIKQLIVAYTPTVIVGAGVGMALNPSRAWITNSHILANIGLMAVLWARYSVEEFELIEKDKLQYFTPATYLTGGVLMLLSPLYSNFLAQQMMSIISKVSRTGGATIAGTVAENTPATLTQLVTRFGAASASGINPTLGMFANISGTWPLAFIGVGLLTTAVGLMVLRKYGILPEEIKGSTYYKALTVFGFLWLLGFAVFFQDAVLFVVAPSILLVGAAIVLIYSTGGFEKTHKIEYRWYAMLPLLWVVTNVLAAASMSRLVFLASFPVAITAGYALGRVVDWLYDLDISNKIDLELQDDRILTVVAIGVILAFVVPVNLASGFVAASQLGGSPNQLWMQNLDYMEQNTEPGSVIMSWWDYGYWFESIGRRPAVADGSNAGYYTANNWDGKTNYPIADFFTSTDPDNHTELFEKHSVDYLVLDHTMIGKYAAVSQISNRDNTKFNSMFSLQTPGSFSQSVSESGNNLVANFQGRGLRAYVPVQPTNTSIDIVGAPTIQTSDGRRANIDCVLTDDGIREFNVTAQSGLCVAKDPFYSFERGLQFNQPARIVMVPKEIAEANLVRLYLMDGYGVDFAEKVEGGSNGYIKMWEINLDEE